jgi:hypothetical protein
MSGFDSKKRKESVEDTAEDTVDATKYSRNVPTFAVSANTSFVTSYPTLFTFPASENVFLLSKLYKLNKLDLTKSFDDAQKEKIKSDLFDFFKNSMNQISEFLQTYDRCIVGLQEQNNTQAVNEEYNKINDCVYLTKNIWDNLMGTYPSCALIIKGFGDLDSFKDVKEDAQTKVFKNGRTLNKYTDVPSDKTNLCYSILNNANSKKLGTRDLGDLFHVNSAKVGDVVYLKGITAMEPSPDSGRVMIVGLQKPGDFVTNVFISMHMLNASVCKPYTKNENGTYTPPTKNEDGTFNVSSILQLKSNTDIFDPWILFCIESIQRHLKDILTNDFELNREIFNNDTTFYICGDFNDPTGDIMTKLEGDGITLFDNYNVKFKFGRKDGGQMPKTGCPNTNSSNVQGSFDPKPEARAAINNNFKNLFDAIKAQPDSSQPDSLPTIMHTHFITDNEDVSILNPNLFAFMGDNCGKGNVNPNYTASFSGFLNYDNLTTDHLMPVVTFDTQVQTVGGKGRKKNRRYTKKKSYKKNKVNKRRYTKKNIRYIKK